MKTQLSRIISGLLTFLLIGAAFAGGKGKDKEHGHHGNPHEYGSPHGRGHP